MIVILLNGDVVRNKAMTEFITKHYDAEIESDIGRVFLDDGEDTGLFIPEFVDNSAYEIFEQATKAEENGYVVLIPACGGVMIEFFPHATKIDMRENPMVMAALS